MIRELRVFLSAFGLFPLLAGATLPNTTPANAVAYEVGQGWVSHFFDETVQTRWFTFGETARHSYCVEAVQGSATGMQLDPALTVYTNADGTTVLVDANGASLQNNNGGGDPNFLKGSRICYISPSPGTTNPVRSFRVNVPIAAGSGDSGFVRIRVTNTTQFAPCVHDPGAGSPSAVMFSNASGQSVAFWAWSVLGTGQASQTTTSAGNAAAYGYGFTNFVIGPAVTAATCYLAHNAPPGTVSGWVRTYIPADSVWVREPLRSR